MLFLLPKLVMAGWRGLRVRARGLAWALLFGSFWALSWMRLQLVNRTIGDYSGCPSHCFDGVVFGSDALIFAILLALVGLSWLMPRVIRLLLALGGLLLIICFAVDIAVFDLLNNRLNLSDILRYAGDVRLNSTVALPTFSSARSVALLGLTALTGFSLVALTWRRPPGASRVSGLWPILVVPVLLGMHEEADEVGHIAANNYRDLITINLPSGEDQPYSAALQAALEHTAAPPRTCLAPTRIVGRTPAGSLATSLGTFSSRCTD